MAAAAKFVSALLILATTSLFATDVLAAGDSGTWTYREGQPAVMGKDNDASDGQVKASPSIPVRTDGEFGNAYRAAGNPKMAIFFNRTISGTPSSWTALNRAVVSGLKEEQAVAGRNIDPIYIVRGNGGFGRASSDVSAGKQSRLRLEFKNELNTGDQSGVRSSPLSEIQVERVRSAFEDEFLSNGVNILDRSMMIRLQSSGSASDDLQALEIDALKGYADLVLVAYGIDDAESPMRVAWRLMAINVNDSRIVYSGLVRGEALREMPSETWKAGSGGFEKAEATDMDADEIGRRLSQAVMSELGPRL